MPQNKPFFVPAKEVSLFDTFNQELIDDIAGQYVDIYRVSAQDTDPNIYGESDKKYFHAAMWFVFSAESSIFTENRLNVLAARTLSLNKEGFRNSFGTDSL